MTPTHKRKEGETGMRKLKKLLFAALALLMLAVPALAQAGTRALLAACSEFLSQPDLGNASSGNLQMIAAALLGADERPQVLSIEDGTIGTVEALCEALQSAFGEADENDLSILYLCTHGVLSSSDDNQVYLLLGDGETETPLSALQLYEAVRGIQGEKLLIIDACFSGALIGRGLPAAQNPAQPPSDGHPPLPEAGFSALLGDPSIHVLTSASGSESSWYFDSESLATGALSYFASALSTGLGLYGTPEADLSGDGVVTLAEMHRYLNVAVPSSSSQLLSACADSLSLPTASRALLARPLTGFSYGASLLYTDDPTLEFSFTVTTETAVQYRLIDYDSGRWNWEEAQTFMDEGDGESGLLAPGRKTRSLTLPHIGESDSGYLMLQIFSVANGELILCSERLIAVQPADSDAVLSVRCDGAQEGGAQEVPIAVTLSVPAELTISIFDEDGLLVRRIAASQLTRPSAANATHLYWDGRDAQGLPAPQGRYTVAVEAYIGGIRQKALCAITL